MSDLTDLLPKRSVEDILAERIRLSVGGQEFILPSLNIDDTETWLSELNGEIAGLLASFNEDADISALLAELAQKQDRMVDLLITYDKTGVLPDRAALRAGLTPLGLIRAVLEVWRAANPLVDIALTGIATTGLTALASPTPTSSRRRNGTGRPVTSGAS